MDVLLVEDDIQLAELLQRIFSEDGHAPTHVSTLAQAGVALNTKTFDLVVLDWMLPDGDGVDLCDRLRSQHPSTAVLMLTARGEVDDRVAGLRRGADDYLTKPFEVEELLARVDAIHRRAKRDWSTRIGELEIDRRAQTVRAGATRVDLTAREFALLARLADAAEQCVARQTLLSDVWKMDFDPGSGVIDVHVSRLRDKLGAHAWMVETVRGQGIRLRGAR